MTRVTRVAAIALQGLEGALVTVEAGSSRQLPGMGIVGLPDTALNEAKQRVRHAAAACGFFLSDRYVLINLQPADLPKHGSSFDLAIALAALGALGKVQLDASDRVVHIGELGLDGQIRRPKGFLASVVAASRLGFTTVMVPAEAAEEASLVPMLRIVAVQTLTGAVNWYSGSEADWSYQQRETKVIKDGISKKESLHRVDISDVVGQQEAVQSLKIAAVGRHHLHMSGPPGSGKTMLAARLPGILPDLNDDEAILAGSIATLNNSAPIETLNRRPPFESPHHTASAPSIIGSGQGGVIRPGAVSLASFGVLFLDEAQEFPAAILDSLRQPLETGSIDIHRAAVKASLPAQVQLVLASNPCPCGNGGSVKTITSCSCTPQQLRRYAGKISGPLLDRIDLRLFVDRVSNVPDQEITDFESSLLVRASVASARAVSSDRLRGTPWSLNSQVPGKFLRSKKMHPGPAATRVLDRALELGTITLRGYDRTLRVAWSICDLEGTLKPGREEIARALSFRQAER